MTAEERATAISNRMTHDTWSRIVQAITEAVAEAETVAHATGRLNMAIAVEQEQERCAKVALSYYPDDGPGIAAAIRVVKP